MIDFLKKHSIFKDRQAVILMTVSTGLVLILGVVSLLSVEERTFKVDVRFSGYERTLSDKGEWYTLYVFPLFAVLTHLVNSYLSLRAHSLQRTLSLTILTFNVIVLLFTIMVTRSLLGLL